jgi:hypothetical protein
MAVDAAILPDGLLMAMMTAERMNLQGSAAETVPVEELTSLSLKSTSWPHGSRFFLGCRAGG